ncbi:MAG: UDP-3-O-(3-hydroxymyristoyl)glucosamine N-acyltransferase [Bacteroidales bacterium]|nr:UDP-3-O-(3-hydroxymyristoyl)glucosamine N-acyltransferase [Bacteroidales bacterium]
MEFTAKMIADVLHGTVEGDENAAVSNFAKIEEGAPGTLTFLSNMKYAEYIYDTKASIVLVNNDFVPEKPISATLVRVPNAYEALATLMQIYQQATQAQQKIEIEQPSYIAEGVQVGPNSYVGAFSYIAKGVSLGENMRCYPQVYIGENVKIGNNVTLYPGVKIYKDCVIGNNVTLHAGCVIGGDGFGFAPTATGEYEKIPQIGNVVIEDNVEIGANTCIDRSTMGSTLIRKGVKLDNLCHVAHNCEIGENTVMAAQGGLAGSTILGKNMMIGGQCGFAGHMTVADGTMVGARSAILSSIKKTDQVMGYPAEPKMTFFKGQVMLRKMPEIAKQVDALQKEIAELKAKLNN